MRLYKKSLIPISGVIYGQTIYWLTIISSLIVLLGTIVSFLERNTPLPASYLLKSVIECFKDKTVGAICGKLLPKYESTPPSWIKKITTFLPNEEYYITDFSVIDLGNKKKDVGWQYMFWSNWAIRKDIFDKMNGFGPDGFSGDYIFYNGSNCKF